MNHTTPDPFGKPTPKHSISHAEMVARLIKPGSQVLEEMSPFGARLMHATFGISGEAGELLDAVKKHIIYGKDLDRKNMIEELGDIEFYLEELRAALKVTREETLTANMDKLNLRYPGFNYSNGRAIERADKA